MAETVSTTIARRDFSSRSLRLDTLVRLRWLAVAGQAAAVLFVRLALDFPLPTEMCLAVIGLSAALNIVLRARYPATLRLGQWPATALLAYDVIQLGALLYLTGGLENPFSILLLVPVIVSATTLPPRPTIALGIMVVAAATLLIANHLPLPLPNGGPSLPLIYVGGVWVALVSACVFTGVYAFRVAEEARQLAKALNATEMVLAREQHLYALDGLAAAAAHELGTPLATIALVAKELSREMPPGSPHAEDVALLSSQSQRCRDILARLTSMSGQVDHHLARLPLSHLVEEVVEAYRAFAAEIVVTPPKGKGPEPVGRRNPAIVQGLVNLVENAVDFADERVTVGSEWSDGEVMITIADDGPGFSAAIIDRIGEPYVTTRRDAPAAGEADHEAGGLGLGLFIAKTLLERSGATLDLANRAPPDKGAVIRVAWPRARMDTAMDAAGTEAETMAAGAAAEGTRDPITPVKSVPLSGGWETDLVADTDRQSLAGTIMTETPMSLLIVDDDKPFLQRLARAMETRGYVVDTADTVAEGVKKAEAAPPAYAVVDMRLEDGNGLDVIELVRKRRPDSRVVVLTGYGNIATAVTAVKLGAVDYLAKPADADEIHFALTREPGERAPPPENPMSADRVRWEHIQRVYEMCDRNVSETARRLNMHRRTLQRILAKRAPR